MKNWLVLIIDFETDELTRFDVGVCDNIIVDIYDPPSTPDFEVGQHLYNLPEKYEYRFQKERPERD